MGFSKSGRGKHAAPRAAKRPTAAVVGAEDSEFAAAAATRAVDAKATVPAYEPENLPSLEAVNLESARLADRKRFFRLLRSTVFWLVIVVAVAALLATLLLPFLRVSGDSMTPTLQDQDVIVLVKTDDLQAGDLCGFYWQNKLLLKRVIGTPGDVIDIDANGVVKVNGQVIDEPYVDELAKGNCDITLPYQVPENQYFVMGDHRATSVDSRSSDIGCVEKSQILGKILFRVWPIDRIGLAG